MRSGGTEPSGQIRRTGRGRARFVAAVAGAAVALPLLAAPAGAGADPSAPDDLWAVVRDPAGEVEVVRGDEALDAVYDDYLDRTADEVLSVETEVPVRALGTNDPLRPQQWALDVTSFEATWPTTRGQGVVVAVVDTGVRGDHEDLAPILLPGIDYVDGGDGRVDPNGHGTHVAGIVAAQADNARGIAGGAPGVRILPVRVLDENGSGYSSDVAAGIIWAVDHGARVVNLSLGGTSPSQGTLDAIRYALSKRAVVVAAAGNGAQSGNLPVYPGAFDEAIAVGALESNRTRAAFSNYGAYVDLAAPGSGILSTYGSGPAQYAHASGTSMATPYAAAAAALVVAANPKADAARIRDALVGSADDLGPAGHDAEFGWGMIDPRGAVNRVLPPPPGGGSAGRGYWLVDRAGHVRAFGAARHHGDLAAFPVGAPIVASAPTPKGRGYWLAGADGSVYTFGDAKYYGSLGGRRLNAPIVGMAATPSGRGYILLGGDGGIFTFGDARFYGSTGGMRLNAPVLDLAMTSTGRGYWFVAADGGVFTFGDARFHGSTGGMRLNAPVVSMTASREGSGYWMIGWDGGIFAFDAPFHGSVPWLRATYGVDAGPALRVRAVKDGSGYYIMAADGAVFAFGNARFHGSAPGFNPVDLMLVP